MELGSDTASRVERKGSPLGEEAERRHDFGHVVAAAGGKVTHDFAVKNRSSTPVKILRVLNGKPCCGEVKMTPRVLQPGESEPLHVSLRTGQSIGPLSHFAVVETDHPQAREVEFVSVAEVLPEIRFERVGEEAARVFPGKSGVIGFRAVAHGNVGAPPPQLEDGDLGATLPVAWDGVASERTIEGGIIERSRAFRVTLKADETPGSRSDVITLSRAGTHVLSYPLVWEIASALSAAPSGIAVSAKSGRNKSRIVVRSADRQAFKILKIACELSGVEHKPPTETAASTQLIELTVTPARENVGRAADLVISSDHPDQSTIRIPIFVSGTQSDVAECEP